MKHRKILSVLLALAMMMALAVPAFAANPMQYCEGDAYHSEEKGAALVEFSDGWMEGPGTDEYGSETVRIYHLPANATVTFHIPKDSGVWSMLNCNYLWLFQGDSGLKNDVAYTRESLNEVAKANWYYENEEYTDTDTFYFDWPEMEGFAMYGGLFYIVFDGASTQPAQPDKPTQPDKPAEPDKPAVTVPEGATAHTVKYGDTWGQLALNNYGSYGAWKQLWKANGYKGLSTGKDIVLPEELGSYTRLPAQVLAEGEKLYTVKAGDTLGQIAVATYKDINMYKAIFERNADRLKNANSIYEGQVIVLPVKSAK